VNIGFIGLGKLGLIVAECMSKNYPVKGYDIKPVTSDQIVIVDSLDDVVKDTDIIFIAVQTPHDPRYDGSKPSSHLENKDFDYSYVKDVLHSISHLLTVDQTVVLISTVLPGTTRRELSNIIPNSYFVYNPYLIAMGSVEYDMVNPEMIMIGNESGIIDDKINNLIGFYKTLTENNPRIIVGTWEEMECTKIFYNTFISAKLGLVNMIQDVAEKIGNINVDIVADALANSTKRIMGPSYMRPGMGDGGPCHPRDNIALRWLASELDLGYDLFDAIMRAREVQAEHIAKALVKVGLPIVILGESFKPGVPYTDGSYSKLVGHYCIEHGSTVTYDTILDNPAVYLLAHDVDNSNKLEQMAKGSVVIYPWRKLLPTDSVSIIQWGNTRRNATNLSR